MRREIETLAVHPALDFEWAVQRSSMSCHPGVRETRITSEEIFAFANVSDITFPLVASMFDEVSTAG